MTWHRHIQELISRADDDSGKHHSNHGQYMDKRLPHRTGQEDMSGSKEET